MEDLHRVMLLEEVHIEEAQVDMLVAKIYLVLEITAMHQLTSEEMGVLAGSFMISVPPME